IVVLTSGANDSTALKNRCDEDRMFEFFMDFARKRPEIEVCYRPHPLWAHPEHQGINSIERLFHYVDRHGPKNLSVSIDAMMEGKNFKQDGNISRQSKSISKEIAEAELVVG